MSMYAITIDKVGDGYRTVIMPARQSGNGAPKEYADWKSLDDALERDAHYTVTGRQRTYETIERTREYIDPGLDLSDEDAMALGWPAELLKR